MYIRNHNSIYPLYINNKTFKVKIAIFIAILLVFIYFHPTNETMHCNKNLVCNVERTHLGILKTHKDIVLHPDSNLSCDVRIHALGKRRSYYGAYIKLDGISPFIYYTDESHYYTTSSQKEELNKACEQYRIAFYNYINNYGKYNLTVTSKANYGELILFVVIAFILGICLFLDELKQLKIIK